VGAMRLRRTALMVALGAGAVALLSRRRAELPALPAPAEEGVVPAAASGSDRFRRAPSGIVAVVDDLLGAR
jgi:hypothetical protein